MLRNAIKLIVACFLIVGPLNGQDCACTNCPQFMQDLFVGTFDLNIQGASNPTLGQNGQGVCGVNIHFDHTAICDISITLTSPSGQSITLVGPIGNFCTNMGNTGTDWNISFIPCGSGAVPDPGFNNQWNSDQNWGANNNYSGSYYPFNGCMQNFTGPVNGNWTLTVIDGQPNDTGNLYDYEIIFCDPSGISCVSCEANAGNLLQGDVVDCQGSPDLALDLPAAYLPPASAPPGGEYTYAYVISGTGGVILQFAPSADLSNLPTGNYSVCGISYLTAHESLLPAINGSLTVTQLTNQLNSNTPPFCGNISGDCVNVTINPVPPDVEETAAVCSPNCYEFQGQFYCQTGDYSVDQTDASGCHYNAILHLTVNNPTFFTVNETICPGTCSSNPTFPDACSSGLYQQTLVNANGCDSLLNLNLTVMSINAMIQPAGSISCSQPSLQLSGMGSTTGAGTTYMWSANNGGNISGPNNMINATATSAGTYSLMVCRNIAGASCCDTAMVTVTSSSNFPNPPVIQGDTSLCLGATQTYTVVPDTSVDVYNWTVPSGVNIISGQGDSALVVQWNSSSGGDICVTAENSCGVSQPTCLTINLLSLLAAPLISGDTLVCKDSVLIYAAMDTLNGTSNFNWQVLGGTIIGGNGSDTIQVIWDSLQVSGMVCANAVNACGQGPQSCLVITINSVPLAGPISGDSVLCAGSTASYSVPDSSGATGFNWTVPAGATIVSGQDSSVIVVNWSIAPGGNVCVSTLNMCGTGPPSCFPVQVFELPVADAGSDSAICSLSINLNAVPSVAGGTGNWTTISGPGISTFSDTSLANSLVTVDSSGLYSFLWTESKGTCIDTDTVQVSFQEAPNAGMLQISCDGSNQNYTVSFPINGGSSPFTVAGGTVTNNQFSSDPIPSGQAYSFIIIDANNCTSTAIAGAHNCNCTSNAGTMSQMLLNACPGDSVTAQSAVGVILDADDVGAYYLHTNSGPGLGTILATNSTGTFGFLGGMTYGTTYYISYVVGNNQGGQPDLLDPCLSVAAGQPVVFYDNPMPDAGPDITECGLSLIISGNTLPGTILWAVTSSPPGGILTIDMPQNNTSTVSASVSGVYTLSYTVSDNGCVGTGDIELTFAEAPSPGILSFICDASGQNYTVSFDITSGLAPFTVNGTAITGNQFNSAPIMSGGSYDFIIVDANGCPSANIVGTNSCNCQSNAGQVGQNLITVCQSDSVSAQQLGGLFLDADDVLSYVLHTSPGISLGTILAQNHSGKFGYWVNLNFGTTYYISPVVGNNLNGFPDPLDPCLSITPGQPIVFLQNPTPNAGADFVVCGLSANMASTQNMFPGAWTQVSGAGTATFNNAQNPMTPVMASATGVYFFRWTQTNGICTVTDDVMATFLDKPVVTQVTPICNATNTGYTLSFTVNSNASPFSTQGLAGSFNGNTFTSALLPNNSSYSFIVKDAFGCQSAVVAGNFLCNCSTDAGTMDSIPLLLCADITAIATWNNDASLDGDDGIQYILHDQPGGTAGTVFAVNSLPEFSFGPGLQAGITYYISAVAGNNVAGTIDPSDPCFSVSAGTPVQWKALPFATISGDATICNGSSTVLNINGTGQFPLDVMYDDGSGTPTTLSILDPLPISISVSPSSSSTYSLLSVSDNGTPMCAAMLNEQVTVTVNQPVDAGMAAEADSLCAGTAQMIQLGNLINGEDAGGVWSETSVLPSSMGAFNMSTGIFNTAGQVKGTYTFQYFMQAGLPCPSQSSTVSVEILPTPLADAGQDQFLDCHQAIASLGGPGTTIGPNIQYSWSLGGQVIDSTAQLNSDLPGIYTLFVNNDHGCFSEDNVTVTADTDIPSAGLIAVTDISCYGANNGTILLDSIQSNHQPVLFSLNGGPYGTNHIFQGLAPDVYTVTLLDNNGCEWMTDSLVVLEPPLLTVDLGAEIVVTYGDSVMLEAMASVPLADLSSLQWNPLFDTLNSFSFVQRFLPFNSKYVQIELADSNGCKATSRILVRVERPEQVYVPNIFKPASEFNNRLTVYGGPGVAEIESFLIFDRWGEQLFEARNFQPNDISIGWDGSFKGRQVLPAVYIYLAKVRFIDGETDIYKGDVTVFR